MKLGWRKGFNPEIIIERIKAVRSIDGDKVSFAGLEFHEYEAIIKSMVARSDNIPSYVNDRYIFRAISAAAKKADFDKDDLLDCISQEFHSYLKLPRKPQTLVTSLSIQKAHIPDDINFDDCCIRFFCNLPNSIAEARQKAFDEFSDYIKHDERRDYMWVLARTNARSPQEAATVCLNAIDLVRGMWGMFANNSMRISMGRDSPVNNITLGELHTLHNQDSSLAATCCWYEPNYHSDGSPLRFNKGEGRLQILADRYFDFLKKSKYRPDLERAIISYTRALDSHDYDVSFIRLWQVLEEMTGTTGSYDKTIKRVSFLYKEWPYMRELLKHLRNHRNFLIHRGIEEKHTETHVYQLKNCVERVIRFHLGNELGFSSLAEAVEFLDLPPDNELLMKRLELHKKGLKYRTPK